MGVLRALKKIQDVNMNNLGRVVSTIQDYIADISSQLSLVPFLVGTYKKEILLIPGQDTFVNHGLGMQYQGFIVIRPRNGIGQAVESTTVNKNQDKYLILTASDNVTADLWVF